eukprot:gb/GEZN01019693.1/.p1 GENE.gb/GEZN01019693.1/~~gb/GEZN01019693.1/.p1  ORF type:complete len:188 (+),score=18.64 gb/GEZN01019693.1/:66-566(+)
MAFGWGAMVLGVLIMRYRGRGLKQHQWIQIVSLLVVLTGWVFGYMLGSRDTIIHFAVGTAAVVLALFQATTGIFRSLCREPFHQHHPGVGRAALLLALVNIAIGIKLAGYSYTNYFILLGVLVALIVVGEWRKPSDARQDAVLYRTLRLESDQDVSVGSGDSIGYQ